MSTTDVVISSLDAHTDKVADKVVVTNEVAAHTFNDSAHRTSTTDTGAATATYSLGKGYDARSTPARRAKAHHLKHTFERSEELSKLLSALPENERAVFWTEETCERFLAAREEDTAKAEEMLRATLKWRAKHKPFQIRRESIRECLEAGTVFVAGRCKAGRPVMYMSVGTVNNFPAVKRLQVIAYLMEEAARRGHTQLTWVFNFARLGENKGTDPEAKQSRKMMMDMCQNHYPERLGALHLINTPWYINMLATIVWPFLEKKTREKINLKCTNADLLKYIDEEELLDTFGGKRTRDTATAFA